MNKDYTLEDFREMKKNNTELWQKGKDIIVRQFLIEELQSGRYTASDAEKIARELEIEQDEWRIYSNEDSSN